MHSSVISEASSELNRQTCPSEFNIRVICRFRPIGESERDACYGSSSVAKFPQGSEDTVFVGGRVYVFDKVFGPTISQYKVYDDAARQIVVDILNGYNGTIFAYGQTASGKTHTMEGVIDDDEQQGIIPRIVADIFDHIYSMSSNLQFQIKVSYFEIYMDKIRDLLDTNKNNLAVHEDKNRVPYVKGCTERFVACPDEVFSVIEEGKANRHVAVTNMNEHSSRSHSVFLIDVKQENLETDKKLTGRLYLVDLAGSEKVSKTGAEGSTLDEAKNINRSLSALGNVIAALADGTKSHVPYRDSKLTRILQESLGGNARTTVIICCSMSAFNESETRSTLYFGQRAKMIKNSVVVNEELTAEEWKRRYDREHERVVKLRGQLAACERELLRWRSGQKVDESQMVNFQYNDRRMTESSSFDNSSSSSKSRFYMSASTHDSTGVNLKTGHTRSKPPKSLNLRNAENIEGSSLTDDERVLIVEKHCNALYRQLDEKDEEINQLEQRVNALAGQQSENDSIHAQLREQNQRLIDEEIMMHSENMKMKEEVKELLNALQELAIKCDQKSVELNSVLSDANKLMTTNEELKSKLSLTNGELDKLKENETYHEAYALETLSDITNDLKVIREQYFLLNESANSTMIDETEFGPYQLIEPSNVVQSTNDNSDNKHPPEMIQQSLETIESTNIECVVRSCKVALAKLKLEAKHLRDHFDDGNSNLLEANRTMQNQKCRLDEASHNLREMNARLLSMREAKEELELRLQHAEQSTLSSAAAELSETTNDSSDELNRIKRDLTRVECELTEKRKVIEELRENISLETARKQEIQEDMEKMKTQYASQNHELQTLIKEKQQSEKSTRELKILEELVAVELANLNKIRKIFVADLHKRTQINQITGEQLTATNKQAIKNSDSATTDDPQPTESSTDTTNINFIKCYDDSSVASRPSEHESQRSGLFGSMGSVDIDELRISDRCGSIVSKKKIEVLEDNLKNLTSVYRDLMKENADLKLEIPKLEKRLTATYERLRSLENALNEARESATKDRKKYMLEVNRIREVMKNRQGGPRRPGNSATIVKPIKGGGGGAVVGFVANNSFIKSDD